MNKLLTLLALLASVAGCDTRETYEDVSAEARSMAVIGTRYEVVGPVEAYGYRRHSQAPVDKVALIPPPGIEGTTIGFNIPVRQGSTVTVRKVIRTNRVFENKMNLEVDLQGMPLPVDAPVTIELMRGNEGDGYLQLNPKIYRKLPAG
jgi:hypothetical protein